MKIAVYDDSLRAIAGFDRLRPKLDQALLTRHGVPLDRVRLRAPIVFPTKVVAAPANYRLHIEEMRSVVTREIHAIEKYGGSSRRPRRSSAPATPSSCRFWVVGPITRWRVTMKRVGPGMLPARGSGC